MPINTKWTCRSTPPCFEGLKQCRGRVMLSGYPHKLYDQTLAGWTRYELKIDNKVSGASKKREMTESLWCNF